MPLVMSDQLRRLERALTPDAVDCDQVVNLFPRVRLSVHRGAPLCFALGEPRLGGLVSGPITLLPL